MVKNKKKVSSFFPNFVKIIDKFIKILDRNSRKYKRFYQSAQLTFIYFFATVVLLNTVKSTLDTLPEIIYNIIPFLSQILNNPLLKIFATPEKTFILYLLILELLLNRSTFNFSILVKFNILFIFLLEMFQNLIICYWDLFFSRELDIIGGNIMLVQGAPIIFFTVYFFFFFLVYLYSYIRGLQGLFPRLPGPFHYLIDSVGFWLQIKLPKEIKE